MLKQHSFSNPFSGIKEKFQKSGRSNSAPGAYDIYIDRLIHISLCFCFSSRFLSFFLWIQPFSTRTPLNAWLLPLFWFFVQNSLSLFPSVVPARANACKCFPFAKDSEQHEKPSICKLQRSALTYSINSFNYSTMAINFAWFLTTKPYHMHAVK